MTQPHSPTPDGPAPVCIRHKRYKLWDAINERWDCTECPEWEPTPR